VGFKFLVHLNDSQRYSALQSAACKELNVCVLHRGERCRLNNKKGWNPWNSKLVIRKCFAE